MWKVYWYLPHTTGQLTFRTVSSAYVVSKKITKHYRHYGIPVKTEVRWEDVR